MSRQHIDNRNLPENATNNTLLHLHLAEYQALNNRGSYWIVLQYGLMAVVPVYIGIACQAWNLDSIKAKEAVTWATLASLQFVGLLWAMTMLQQFAIVKYQECYLRPLIMVDLKPTTDRFWGYEPHLVKRRPNSVNWGHFLSPLYPSLLY